jgi:hypothetical protein
MSARLAPLPPAAAVAGGVLFARYAYPPNAHAYCGPADAEEVFADATGQQDPAGLRTRAQEFTGAWPYLQLIADANGVADVLDPRVVQAYWLGSAPAEAVPLRALADHVDRRFRHRAGVGWNHLGAALQPGAIPDHAFHVLAVYPWVGLLREGVTEPARTVLESCCIRPGVVTAIDEQHADVRVPTLDWNGSQLTLAASEDRRFRWRRDGFDLAGDIRPGDEVAVHWDWICERLDRATAATLTRRLGTRLASVRC